MRYMMFVKIPTATSDEAWQPSADDVATMSRYNAELEKAGILLALDGLHPESEGARLEFPDEGKPKVIDGPFSEAKEVVGGYWIIDVSSKEEAIEWASRCPMAGGQIEIRRLQEMEDFPADVRDALAAG